VTWGHRFRRAAFARMPAHWRPAAAYHYYRARSLLERELAFACRRLHPGVCAVDVGANEGVYTHAFARTGAQVEAFEPEPGCLAVLKAYERRHPNVRAHAEALGAGDGLATLHVPLHDGVPITGHATLEAPMESGERYEVKVRPLDAFTLANVAVIKVDVEGRELDVLQGARETIERWRPTLVLEIEQRHIGRPVREVFDTVRRLGYEGSFLHPVHGRISIDAFDGAAHQNSAVADVPRALYINNFIFEPRSDVGGTA
jgi:FkbM family methyltransferase